MNRLERERQGETGGKGKRKIKELDAKHKVKIEAEVDGKED